MLKYILKRLLWLIPILLGVSILIFTITYFTEGDPARIMMGSNATAEQLENAREEMGLNKSFAGQYLDYMAGVVFRLDLGVSYISKKPVLNEIAGRAPYTVRVAFISLLLSILIGIPLGIIAATHQYSWKDNLSMLVSMIFVSMPNFWVALMLTIIFSLKLGLLPAVGVANWKCYIMPCFAVCLAGAANFARQTRSSMLEVIRQDYIVTARAKGVKENIVICKHAMKNALIPIITVIGNRVGHMLSGALIAETVFSIPGMGTYILTAINNRDYPVIRGTALVICLWFSLCMLLVDIIFAAVDPRIRSQFAKKR